LWAATLADINSYPVALGHSALGFANAGLYRIANGFPGTSYANDFHDINTFEPVTGVARPNE